MLKDELLAQENLSILATNKQQNKAPRRSKVKTSKRKLSFICVAAIVAIALPGHLLSQTATLKSSSASIGSGPQCTVQVKKVNYASDTHTFVSNSRSTKTFWKS